MLWMIRTATFTQQKKQNIEPNQLPNWLMHARTNQEHKYATVRSYNDGESQKPCGLRLNALAALEPRARVRS
jgi:hypothetical protein